MDLQIDLIPEKTISLCQNISRFIKGGNYFHISCQKKEGNRFLINFFAIFCIVMLSLLSMCNQNIIAKGDDIVYQCLDNYSPTKLDNFFTYIGGNDADFIVRKGCVLIDQKGNTIVAGTTRSSNLFTLGGLQNNSFHGWDDIFIMKFNKGEMYPIFSTYLGGSGSDFCNDIILDIEGNIILCGETFSDDFPVTPDAFCKTRQDYSSQSGYISKISANGTDILFSTFIQTEDLKTVSVHSIVSDLHGNVCALGRTYGNKYPVTQDAFDPIYNGGGDIFISKFDENCSSLLYSTYLGGSKYDDVHDCWVDSYGNLYCTGSTNSVNFPTTLNAFQRQLNGASDAFIFKLSQNGTSLEISTYVGGSNEEIGNAIIMDSNRTIIITGLTDSSDYPISSDAMDSTIAGNVDCVLTQLSHNGSKILYSTFIGGDEKDMGTDLELNNNNEIYLVGQTDSTNFPIQQPCFDMTTNGGSDIFALRFNLNSHQIISSTYIGGSDHESNAACAIQNETSIILIGETSGINFPTTTNAFKSVYNGGPSDLFLCKFQLGIQVGNKPSMPEKIHIEAMDRQIKITWEKSLYDGGLPILGYLLYRGFDSNNKSILVTLNKTTYDYIDTSIKIGFEYFYAISCFNTLTEGFLNNSTGIFSWGQPTAPVNFSATPGCGTVSLQWNRPLDFGDMQLQGYRVYRGDNRESLLEIVDLKSDIYGFIDENVINGNTYYYRITGFNLRGEGGSSGIINITPIGPPDRVSTLFITSGDALVNLRWEAPEVDGGRPIQGYTILRGMTKESLSVIVILEDVYTYLDINVLNNITYYYSIYAMNSLGNGTIYPIIIVQPKGRPGSPTNFTASSGNGCIILRWMPPENDGGFNITSYRVYRGIYPEYLIFLVSTGPVGIYSDLDVLKGDVRYYRIRALNNAGEGPPSDIIEIKVLGTPGPPQNLRIELMIESVMLKWSAPSDWGGAQSLSFMLYRGSSNNVLEPLNIVVNQQEYLDYNLTLGKRYFYTVLAINDAGLGPMSVTVSIIPGSLPGAPSNLTTEAHDRSVMLHWFMPESGIWLPVTGYIIYRGIFISGLVEVGHLNSGLSYNDTQLDNGVAYYYAVAAVNSIGIGNKSIIVIAIPGRVPESPIGLKAIVRGNDVLLQWTLWTSNEIQVNGYMIFRGIKEDHFTQIATVNIVAQYMDNNTTTGTKYYYRIIAFNEYGSGEPSTIVSIEVDKNSTRHWMVLLGLSLGILFLIFVFIKILQKRKIV